jgi:chorismate mutase
MQTSDLDELRQSLDRIDTALIALLAERFQITRKIGLYKKENALPSVDATREAEQFARIEQLAQMYGLDQPFLKSIFRLIIDQVVADHEALRE